MAYWQADLIVEGALQEDPIIYSANGLADYVEKVQKEYGVENAPAAELFVIFHDHAEDVDCECSQFVSDHHAEWSNVK